MASNGAESSAVASAKRPRLVLSCHSCKTRKVKCSKEVPCNNCVRRGEESTCYQEERRYAAPMPAYASRDDIAILQGQIAQLHTFHQRLVSSLSVSSQGSMQMDGQLLEELNKALSVPLSSRTDGPEVQQAHDQLLSDSEEAALTLEDFAMGKSRDWEREVSPPAKNRQPYHGLRTPLHDRIDNNTDRYYSILKSAPAPSSLPGGFTLNVTIGNESSLLDCLCNCDVSPRTVLYLVDLYFCKVSFHWSVFHEPTFRTQVGLFLEILAAGRLLEVDPLFVTCLTFVMSLAINHTTDHTEVGRQLNWSDAAVSLGQQTYFTASQKAFALGETSYRPQIRAIQSILLLSHYFFHNGQRAFTGELDGYFLNLSLAFRSATLLGLNRLSEDNLDNIPDDISLPPGNNPIKRELGTRLWNILVYIDAINASNKTSTLAVPDYMFSTATMKVPSNCSDCNIPDAFSNVDYALPLDQMTDQMIELGRHKIATQHRQYFQKACRVQSSLSYEEVLEFDHNFRRVLQDIPECLKVKSEALANEPRKFQWQRVIVEQAILHRILRLHRGYLGKAYRDGQYAYSASAAYTAATQMLDNHLILIDAGIAIEYLLAHLLTAHLVLFHDLFLAAEHRSPDLQSKYTTVLKSIEVFRRSQYFVSAFLVHLGRETYALSQLLLQVYERQMSLHNGSSAQQNGEATAFSSLLKEVTTIRSRRSTDTSGGVTFPDQGQQQLQFDQLTQYQPAQNENSDLNAINYLDSFFAQPLNSTDTMLALFDKDFDANTFLAGWVPQQQF